MELIELIKFKKISTFFDFMFLYQYLMVVVYPSRAHFSFSCGQLVSKDNFLLTDHCAVTITIT